MSVIGKCDACGWQTPEENTGRRPPGWLVHHSQLGEEVYDESIMPIDAPAADCGCPHCYHGPWVHAIAPWDDPGFWRWVTFGVAPHKWHDFCGHCRPPEGWRQGLPPSWRLARMLVQIAAFLGTLAFWSHILLAVSGH